MVMPMTRHQPAGPTHTLRSPTVAPLGPHRSTSSSASRPLTSKMLRTAVALAVLAGGAFALTGCGPAVVAAAAPPNPVAAAASRAQGVATATVQDVPDDPRLRDNHIGPFDDSHPAIAGLQADLRTALQSAARDAQAQGVEIWVTSGRRTTAYQKRLLEEAVKRYGSLEEAHRYVASPETSSHVTGHAVDIGPTDAADWMIRKGAAYGLCQTYANEMWHFELQTTSGGTCPTPRSDAAS